MMESNITKYINNDIKYTIELIESTRMKFCVDFDNTCCFEDFPNVGENVPGAVKVLKKLTDNGHQIILWTARLKQPLNDAIQWFKDNNIPLAGINEDKNLSSIQKQLVNEYGMCRKVIPDYFIDDKNLGCPLKKYISKKTNKEYICVDWNKLDKVLENMNAYFDKVR